MTLLGIDIGGTGIKAGLVDVRKGRLTSERVRVPTPEKARPRDVTAVVRKIVKDFNYEGPVGVGFPAIIREGIACSAANIEKEWIGTNVTKLLSKSISCPVITLNDADAAGLAEMTFGAGKKQQGVVFIITVGTGLGTAIFNDGKLLPNTELGHLLIKNQIAEHYVSERVRIKKNLSWKKWAKRFDRYLIHLEKLFSPDLFIIGGGGGKHHEKFFSYLTLTTPIVPARLQNEAGIIGAAMAARSLISGLSQSEKTNHAPSGS